MMCQTILFICTLISRTKSLIANSDITICNSTVSCFSKHEYKEICDVYFDCLEEPMICHLEMCTLERQYERYVYSKQKQTFFLLLFLPS